MSWGIARRRRGRIVGLGVAVLAGATLLAMPAAASAKCKPGTHKYGSGKARIFCGKASVTITMGAQKTTLKGGSCTRYKQGFTLNIGTVLLGVDSPNRPDYFGITVGNPPFPKPASTDGTYTGNVTIAFVIKHKRNGLANPTITLTSGRSKGTFSGTPLHGGGTASGTFTCG